MAFPFPPIPDVYRYAASGIFLVNLDQRGPLTGFEKLAESWHRLRVDGRLDCSLEWCTTLFRFANYGICTSHDPQPLDPRQGKLDLQGGSHKRRVVTITVG